MRAKYSTVEATPLTSGTVLWSVPPVSVEVPFARVTASTGLSSSVVIVRSSSSQSAQVQMVCTTVVIVSTASSDQAFSSGVGHFSVPQLLAHGNTVPEGLRGTMDLIRAQREAATRLAASRLVDMKSVPKDLAELPRRISGATRL